MRYLLAYDIASPRRLRKVARLMERHAIRCQKSVFVMESNQAGVVQLLDQVGQIISPKHDIVQAWRLALDQPAEGQLRGAVTPVSPDCSVHEGGESYFVSRNTTPRNGTCDNQESR